MRFSIYTVVILIILNSCSNQSGDHKKDEPSIVKAENNDNIKSDQTYDLTKPTKTWELPEELKEISGNAWVDKNHLLVIEDLHANLYLLKIDENATIEKTVAFEAPKDKKVDIEDVALIDNTAYALWSHGVIYKVIDWANKEQTLEIPTTLDKKNNTEGICFDPVSHKLLIACKNESGLDDEKKSTRAVYTFDVGAGKLDQNPFLLIKKKDFKTTTGEKLDFYPSAIAVHPITHDIYILSTKENKCMAIYSHDGQFKSVQFINKDEMLQPEGICFSPDGTLFISSEGKHGVAAKLFEFKK